MSDILKRRLNELWRLGWRRHLQYTSCTFAALLVLLAMGPSLQTYLSSLVASRAPSIYEMAYENGITDFPDFWTWLIGGIEWTAVIQATVVTAALMVAENRRGAFSYVIVATFVSLFATDLFIAFFFGKVDLTESFVCDVLGSILIGGLVVASLCAATIMQRTTAVVPALREIAAPGLILAGALVCSATTYLIVFFIYQPLEDRFELSVQAPASGAMIIDGPAGGKSVPERLSITGSNHSAEVEIRTVREGKRRSRFFWNAKPGSVADLRVSVLDGCIVHDLRPFVPDLTFRQVRSVVLWSNVGDSYWNIPKANGRGLSISTGGELAFFWLERNKADRNVELTFFGRKSDIGGTTIGGFRTYLNSVSFNEKNRASGFADRRFTLLVDGRPVTMTSKGHADAKRNESLSCRHAGLKRAGGADRYAFDNGVGILPGIVLTLVESGTGTAGDFSIRQISGQFGFSGMTPESWADRNLGRASMISVGGRISDARVADADIRISSVDQVEGKGQMNARSIKDGMMLNGKMRTLWKSQQRLLQTRWERLGADIQVWVLGLLGILFGWLMLKGFPLLRSVSYDEKTPWSR